MMMKSFVPYGILMLVLGSAVAALPLQSNFSLLDRYQIEVDVVYVYLKTFEINENASGLGRMQMLSYVVVLNVTNPTGKGIWMRDVTIRLAKSGSVQLHSNGTGVRIVNGIVRCYRYLPQGDFSYFWYPNSSMMIAFSSVTETNPALMQTTLDSVLEVEGKTSEGAYATSGYVIKTIQMNVLNPSEYVYNAMPGTPRFDFDDGEVGIGIE